MTRRRGILVFAGGILLLLVLAAVFRGALLEPLIVRALQRTLGLTATVERIGGSVVAGLESRG